MQFKVPQNVEREDQIIGPVTMKQLIICTVGGFMTYAVYVFLAKRYTIEVWLIPTVIPALLTLAIAFVKINDIPFTKWILLLVEYLLTANKRVWTKGADQIKLVELPNQKKTQATQNNSKNYDQAKVRNLVKTLDSADYSHLAESKMKEIETEKRETEHAERLSKIIAQPPQIKKGKSAEKPTPKPIIQKKEEKKEKQSEAPQKKVPAKPKIPMKVIVAKSAQKKKPIVSPQFKQIKSNAKPQPEPESKPKAMTSVIQKSYDKARNLAQKTENKITEAGLATQKVLIKNVKAPQPKIVNRPIQNKNEIDATQLQQGGEIEFKK